MITKKETKIREMNPRTKEIDKKRKGMYKVTMFSSLVNLINLQLQNTKHNSIQSFFIIYLN